MTDEIGLKNYRHIPLIILPSTHVFAELENNMWRIKETSNVLTTSEWLMQFR